MRTHIPSKTRDRSVTNSLQRRFDEVFDLTAGVFFFVMQYMSAAVSGRGTRPHGSIIPVGTRALRPLKRQVQYCPLYSGS